jgi:hypothetical protein
MKIRSGKWPINENRKEMVPAKEAGKVCGLLLTGQKGAKKQNPSGTGEGFKKF